MSKIKILDESTIQQIAAGEVIERPSSIVKELVENSIDAMSNNITIEIKDGGKSYIRITDDGEGMSSDEIGLAFKRHSTSKLSTIEDIYNVLSLGFRGEALASVASVSKVEVLSKTKASDVGVQVFLEEGDIVASNTIGCPKGTTIIVKDIFYNLPVRKKFLKSTNIESNHIGDIINKLALGNPKVSFRFIKDGRNILKTPQNSKISNTIYSVLGKDYYKNLIPVKYIKDDFKLKGFISNNKLYRSNRNHQYLYINGRYISHLNIAKIIEKEYRSLIPLNRLPVFILNIEVNPNEVDVNIHPTKQEIKFVNSEYIYNIISNIVRDNLMPSVSMPKIEIQGKKDKKKELPKLFNDDFHENNDSDRRPTEGRSENFNKNKNIIVKDLTKDNYNNNNIELKEIKEYPNIIKKNIDGGNDSFQADFRSYLSESDFNNKDISDSNKEDPLEQKLEGILLDIKPIGRVFNTYIIVESKNEEKLFFIDQHAAHERVMYEKYKKEYRDEEVVIQKLIYPVVVELTNEEMNLAEEDIEIFEKLGFELEVFGDNSIALRGVPMIFGEPQVQNLFLDILDGLSTNIQSSYETKIDKVMKISCTNAIKGGDKMEDVEIMALFEALKKCDNPYTCPHGRPTIMELSKRELEKYFLRIV